MQIEIKKLPKSTVEITGEIDTEKFMNKEKASIAHLGEDLEIQGFRKGKAPEDIIRKSIGDMIILEEMAQMALSEAYPQILLENKIDAMGRPEISITKIARGNPLGFTIKTAVMPVLTLPDYREIAKKANSSPADSTDVSDKEMEDTINNLRRMRAMKNADHSEGHDHNHPEITDDMLPILDDEFAKSLGNFSGLEEFKAKLRENLSKEKEIKNKEKRKIVLLESIVEKTSVEIPDTLIEFETEKILNEIKTDISNMGMAFEDYLKHINKTEADFRGELKKEGEKKAKVELVLSNISKMENIKPDTKEVEIEIERIMKKYEGADSDRAREYVEHVLTNGKVFEFLESQK